MGLCGGVRRYIEIGNEMIKRGHHFTIYHSDGSQPAWVEFLGDTRPIECVIEEGNDIALCGHHSILSFLEKAKTKKKIFYCVLEEPGRIKRVCQSGKFLIMGNSTGICEKINGRYGVKCIDGIGGINLKIFHPVEVKRNSDEIKILCYGRIYERRKGVKKVVRAVELLSKVYPNLKLILFDSPTGSPRRDPVRMLHTKVHFSFFLDLPQDKMAEMFSQADIFVSAEKRAGWSNTTAEAMACRVPVVCTKSGTRDFAIKGETALLIPFRNSWAIAGQIRKLIRDQDLRKRLAESGYQRIQQYSWERLVDKLEEEFQKLLGLK